MIGERLRMKVKFELEKYFDEIGNMDRISVEQNLHSKTESIETVIIAFKRFLTNCGYNENAIHTLVPPSEFEARLLGFSEEEVDQFGTRKEMSEADDYEDGPSDDELQEIQEIQNKIHKDIYDEKKVSEFINQIKSNSDMRRHVFRLYLEDLMYG